MYPRIGQLILVLILLLGHSLSSFAQQSNQDDSLSLHLRATREFVDREIRSINERRDTYRNTNYDYWIKANSFAKKLKENLQQFEIKLQSILDIAKPLINRYNHVALSNEYASSEKKALLNSLKSQLTQTFEYLTTEYNLAFKNLIVNTTGIGSGFLISYNTANYATGEIHGWGDYFYSPKNFPKDHPLMDGIFTRISTSEYRLPVLYFNFKKNKVYCDDHYRCRTNDPDGRQKITLPKVLSSLKKDCYSQTCITYSASDLESFLVNTYQSLNKNLVITLTDGEELLIHQLHISAEPFMFSLHNLKVAERFPNLPINFFENKEQ